MRTRAKPKSAQELSAGLASARTDGVVCHDVIEERASGAIRAPFLFVNNRTTVGQRAPTARSPPLPAVARMQ
ncbi:MAG: hypothetical protein ACJASD_003716 [Sphingomonas echinoides]|jgi:hypothetical protein